MENKRPRIKRSARTQEHKLLFWPRFLSFTIDALIAVFLLIPGINYLFHWLFSLLHYFKVDFTPISIVSINEQDVLKSLFLVVFINCLIFILYTAILESSRIQATFGKWFLQMKVYQTNGERLSFPRAVVRATLKLLSIVSIVGVLMIDLNEKRQALHDKLSGTMIQSR